jgi:dihydrofolate synthase/folylpolyglutamate synthase
MNSSPPGAARHLPPPGGDTAWQDYLAAVAQTDALIERSFPSEGDSKEEIRARAEMRMTRLSRFLAFLGNPHDRYPIVHVGGTSGKGSTSTAIAAILTAAGYKTGLHTSPYLQVATEKLQIDGKLIEGHVFRALVESTLTAVDAWIAEGGEQLTYGELWMALLARYFAEEQVNIAVIEVGAGGRFDLTNLVRPSVSVITSVGLDHTVTLGSTISEIAWHKAGIIKPGAPVVSAVTDPVARQPILAEVAQHGSDLIEVRPGKTYDIVDWDEEGVRWRELPPIGEAIFKTGSPGRFQAANAATAVAAVRTLSRQGFAIPGESLQCGLSAARIPGRLELMPGSRRIILDGAHNPEKMRSLVTDVDVVAPRSAGQRRIAVVGMLESKEHRSMLELLTSEVDELVLTMPHVLAKPGATVSILAETARELGFAGPIHLEPDPQTSLTIARESARPGDAVLVTGSLFVVGEVRDRWYDSQQIVEQRTPWPRD